MMDRLTNARLEELAERLCSYGVPGGELDEMGVADTLNALGELLTYRAAAPLEKVQERAKAKQEGRLVVLPDTECELCSSKHIDIKVKTKAKDNAYWFSSNPVVGLMHCPLCGRKITREEAKAALDAQKGDGQS